MNDLEKALLRSALDHLFSMPSRSNISPKFEEE